MPAKLGEGGEDRRHVEAAPEIHLGHLGRQLVAIALDQAADGGEPRATCVRGLGGVEDRRDRLLLGGVDEAAGVDDDQVGTRGRCRTMPGGAQSARQRVGVGLVLGAAERLDEEPGARGAPQR